MGDNTAEMMNDLITLEGYYGVLCDLIERIPEKDGVHTAAIGYLKMARDILGTCKD